MDVDENLDHNNRNDIDNLIIAAAAASGDGGTTDEINHDMLHEGPKSSFWRSVLLQHEHIESIRMAAQSLCDSNPDQSFQPEPYNKKQCSEEEYQEMLELTDFKGENDLPERVELMRKHSMVYRPSGPQSRALTLFEQAVNEAAAQICNIHPAAIFQKRNLAYMAKTVVRRTGIDFPNARSSYLLTGVGMHGLEDDLSSSRDGRTVQPAHAAPASASMLLQRTGLLSSKRDSAKYTLTNQECQSIAQTVMEKASEIPNLQLKTREQCSLVENFVYTDACRIMKFSVEQLDEEMDYIREVSSIYGRYPSGPRMPSPSLSPLEIGMNEAAAWLVRIMPTLLTHRRQLTDWARRIVFASELQLTQTAHSAGGSPSHLSGGNLGSSHSGYNQNYDCMGGSDGTYQLLDGGQNQVEGIHQLGNGIIAGFDEDESGISADNNDLIKYLGGSQAISQLPDPDLEDLGRAQFTVVDSNAAEAIANKGMEMTVEEDDKPLDEAEILRVSNCATLEDVTKLIVPCCGYTSIISQDLSQCVNLVELDLSENALRVFPRRLHLPKLRKLGLIGNRFFHLPMVEQFPLLTRFSIDERSKQLLNPQMLAYFCPHLKQINGHCFDEIRTDFTMTVISEAKSFLEPHIRSKWEGEFADEHPTIPSREELLKIIEKMVQHLRERSSLMDESINKYKDLMLFRFVESYLRSKFPDIDATGLVFSGGNNISQGLRSRDNDDRGSEEYVDDILMDSNRQDPTQFLQDFEEDEEERESAARAAGEKALFDAADELLGMNLPDFGALQSMQNQAGQGSAFIVDAMGRLQQSQQQMVPGNYGPGWPSYPFHLGRSLRQGRSIVMTVVRPQGISGRPVAEFLPGELRNKDYVKGYMASEIYKKAVKDTLGQKGAPKKRPGPGRPKKSDVLVQPQAGKNPNDYSSPLAEVNNIEKKAIIDEGQIRTDVKQNERFDAMQYNNRAPLPPRPKKRKSMGMHSLRDLCVENNAPQSINEDQYSSIPPIGSSRTDTTLIDYDPLHFIRCHAKDNDAGDSETKVWRCLFEPNPNRPEETTHVVATCGGECVCLINCETGKVLKRFKHVEEEFYTIAWTTVEVETGTRANILAAAGKMREIRLLHPEQLVCYAEMKGHTEDITAMIFHQTQSTVLFSGDSKASVLVWDIGTPSVPNYKTRYQLLMRLRCPRLDVNPVLNLVFLPHYAYLVAGCEDGLFAWKISELRLEKREREPDMELKLDIDREVCIDGLAQLSENALVIKVVESGEIMVFDFASVLERRKGLQRIVPLEMRGHLMWQKTDEIYINVSVRHNLGAVICGDHEGSIWIYDLDPYLDDLHASSRKKFHVKPIKILEWPECSVQGNRDEDQQLKESISSGFRNPVVNSVEMSSDGHYLAAVTDNNLVCIWRYAPPSNSTGAASVVQNASTASGNSVNVSRGQNNVNTLTPSPLGTSQTIESGAVYSALS